jgi:hypothetical protein
LQLLSLGITEATESVVKTFEEDGRVEMLWSGLVEPGMRGVESGSGNASMLDLERLMEGVDMDTVSVAVKTFHDALCGLVGGGVDEEL